MDKTPKLISSSSNNDDGMPEKTGMEKVLSDLHALEKLYRLLQRLDETLQLDETSRALLRKLLDDATRQALQKQAKALTTAPDSVIPFSLGLSSPKKMDQTTSSRSSFLNKKESEIEPISSDLGALTKLYSLLHKGAPDENLDEASRALLMKILEDATQEVVRRQAKMLSGSLVPPALERKLSMQSDWRTQHADPRPRPVASPRPSLLASERSRRLNLQHSTVSSRSGLHADGHRHAAEEPPLARLASKRSSRTALPARHRASQEQRHTSLSLHRFPVAGTPTHGTVTRSTARLADRRDSIRHSSSHGNQWSLERSSSSGGSSRRSLSRELSLGLSSRMHGCATPRHVGTETESSSSARSFERLNSGFSLSTTSRRGGERAGRGVATPRRSSSSNTVATIQSRIRPSSTLLTERSLRRSAVQGKGRTPRGRQRQQCSDDVSSADVYSSSRSSSGAASLSASMSPPASPAPPAPRAFATPYYYSPPATGQRGIVPPVHAPVASRSMRRRRRQEILEKRVARLRMLKEKIATVFHHRHDHHHHHHIGGGGGVQEAGPSSRSRSVVRGAGHLNSPWQFLTSMFHHVKGKDKNTNRSRAAVAGGVPEKKRRGGGGKNMHALFDAVRRHLKGKGKRRAPAAAGIKLRRKASRARAKKMHWWQRLRQRRGMAGLTAGGRPRRRLGHGKAGWL